MPLVYELRVIERKYGRNGIVSCHPFRCNAFLKAGEPCIVLHSLHFRTFRKQACNLLHIRFDRECHETPSVKTELSFPFRAFAREGLPDRCTYAFTYLRQGFGNKSAIESRSRCRIKQYCKSTLHRIIGGIDRLSSQSGSFLMRSRLQSCHLLMKTGCHRKEKNY